MPVAGMLAVTRIANACVLLEFGSAIVLTDPWFVRHPAFTEQPALRPQDLPRLSAIVGSHRVRDHWGVRELRDYPRRDETPVLVATSAMAAQARAVGFKDVIVAEWNTTHRLSGGLIVEVVPSHISRGHHVNNYIFTLGEHRVFFGGEMRGLVPLEEYRREHPPVTVCLVPVNGMSLLGRRLVADAREAIQAARILGATTVIPIHYAHRSLGPVGGPTSTFEDASRAAAAVGTQLLRLNPGEHRVIAS